MEIAQKHTSTEQQHQARQYNKHVKGTYLSVGDRVLVANKGERGKRKLADKWEDKVYTVVDMNPGIHVYKIQDAAGQIRVVHRNLLLEVNFLPLPHMDHSGHTDTTTQSFADDESDQEDCGSSDGTVSLSETPSQAGGSSPQEDEVEPPTSPSGGLSHSGSADPEEPSETSPVSTTDITLHEQPAMPVIRHSVSDLQQPMPVDTSVHTDSHALTTVDGCVKTRAGRLVKSVNRLIESMIQKPVLRGTNVSF
ncbi:hypothetical protein LDENG_00105450 [Lucifuga dentata]|nr:hypothetical protein LDENG_00105450 [Lucifuga dentata]